MLIERHVGQMTRHIEDLLDASHATGTRRHCGCTHVDLRTIVEFAVNAIAPDMARHGHRLVVSLPADALWVHADVARLEQVFSNLLINAAKYTPDGGDIALTMERIGTHACIRFCDSGIGIAPAMLGRVFELFAQADAQRCARRRWPRHRARGGARPGGGAWRQRAGHERRSRIGQRVHRAVAGAVGASDCGAGIEREMSVPSDAPPRILIVDDDVELAQSLATMLEAAGAYETRIVHSAADAVAAAVEFPPAIVFLDIELPDMSGYEVAKLLHQHAQLQATRLIALTDSIEHPAARRCARGRLRALSRQAGDRHRAAEGVAQATQHRALSIVRQRTDIVPRRLHSRAMEISRPLALILLIASAAAFGATARTPPANSVASQYGDGWDCARGFRQTGDRVRGGGRSGQRVSQLQRQRLGMRSRLSESVARLRCRPAAGERARGRQPHGTGWRCDRGFRESEGSLRKGDRARRWILRGLVTSVAAGNARAAFASPARRCARVEVPAHAYPARFRRRVGMRARLRARREQLRAGGQCPPTAISTSRAAAGAASAVSVATHPPAWRSCLPANAHVDYSGNDWSARRVSARKPKGCLARN